MDFSRKSARNRRIVIPGALVALVLLTTVAVTSLPIGASQGRALRATLTGFDEVPAVSTLGAGSFEAKIDPDGETVPWVLSYDGTGSVTQSHIHLGRPRTNGGFSVWLCSNLPSPPTPPGVQPCPPSPATISGTIDGSQVIGPSNQGIGVGELAKFLRAVRAGATYVNVHSTTFPGGEIRGQIE